MSLVRWGLSNPDAFFTAHLTTSTGYRAGALHCDAIPSLAKYIMREGVQHGKLTLSSTTANAAYMSQGLRLGLHLLVLLNR